MEAAEGTQGRREIAHDEDGLGATPAWRTILAAAVLVVATLLAYLPSFGNGFVWDDEQYVHAQPLIESWGGLARIWLEPGATKAYYPVTFTTFFVEHLLWGKEPRGYHAVNVLLHVVNALLVWACLGHLRVPGAWGAALLFALHPVHVESVAWVAERKNLASGLCYLAATLAWLSYRRSRARMVLVLSFLLFMGAVLAKTVTCTWPVAMLLLWFWTDGRVTRRALVELSPFLVVGAGLAALSIHMERALGARGEPFALAPLERLVVAGKALWFYPAKLVWPAQTVFIYPRFDTDPHGGLALLPLAAAITLATSLFALRRRIGRGPFAAIAFYGVTIFPALGFVSFYPMLFSFVADHFQYLASLGVIALVGAGLARLASRRRAVLGGLLLASIVASIVPLTVMAQAKYRNAFTLWSDTLEQNPRAWIAHNNLGVIFAEYGMLEQALYHFRKVLEVDPGSADFRSNVERAERALQTKRESGAASPPPAEARPRR